MTAPARTQSSRIRSAEAADPQRPALLDNENDFH